MTSVLILPVLMMVVLGLLVYASYILVIRGHIARKRLQKTFLKKGIRMTPEEIITKYHALQKRDLSNKELKYFLNYYTNDEPEQFLSMYEKIRDES